MNQFSRTELMFGAKAVEKLKNSHVAIFGIGGVGGYVCEALARSGVGKFDLIDNDEVCLTNINRQIIATHRTIGQAKVDAMRERINDINPEAEVNVHKCFFLPETASEFDFSKYDYVVDAVDTVTAKIQLVLKCEETETPIISSMGAGNKIDPTAFRVADIYKTKNDPLAKVMRRELKDRGVKKLQVVYSEELPFSRANAATDNETGEVELPPQGRRAVPGSNAFVPSVAGLIIAGEVIKKLINEYL